MDLTFRCLEDADIPLLARWLGELHVHRWWEEHFDLATVEAKYAPRLTGAEPTEVFIVEADGEPIGMIQRYLVADYPEWVESLAPTGYPAGAAGMDYLIGAESLIGQGIGPAMLGAFVEECWVRYPEAPAMVVDIDPENRRSWRALEKIGFTRIWEGHLEAEDPSDAGPAVVYVLERPAP